MKRAFCMAVLLGFSIGPVAAWAATNDAQALTDAIHGKPHTCIAVEANASTALVHCELGDPNEQTAHVVNRDFTVPLAWVKAHFDAVPGKVVKWISGGRDANGNPIPARV